MWEEISVDAKLWSWLFKGKDFKVLRDKEDSSWFLASANIAGVTDQGYGETAEEAIENLRKALSKRLARLQEKIHCLTKEKHALAKSFVPMIDKKVSV